MEHIFDKLDLTTPASRSEPFDSTPPIRPPAGMVVLVDKNELIDQHRGYLIPDSEAVNLGAGDYSVRVGKHDLSCLVAVERKTLTDLLGCVSGGRGRFEAALARLAALPQPHVVIETTFDRAMRGRFRHTKVTASALVGSVIAWCARHRVPFWFASSRLHGELLTRWILTRAALDFCRDLKEQKHNG